MKCTPPVHAFRRILQHRTHGATTGAAGGGTGLVVDHHLGALCGSVLEGPVLERGAFERVAAVPATVSRAEQPLGATVEGICTPQRADPFT